MIASQSTVAPTVKKTTSLLRYVGVMQVYMWFGVLCLQIRVLYIVTGAADN